MVLTANYNYRIPFLHIVVKLALSWSDQLDSNAAEKQVLPITIAKIKPAVRQKEFGIKSI